MIDLWGETGRKESHKEGLSFVSRDCSYPIVLDFLDRISGEAGGRGGYYCSSLRCSRLSLPRNRLVIVREPDQ